MEYILKKAEEVDQQWAEIHQQQEQQERPESGRFKSVFTINGKSILSPVMTPERRLEMQQLRQAAMAIEVQMARLPGLAGAAHGITLRPGQPTGSGCCRLVDASTNTEPHSEAVQQPLTVIGRFKQQLQFSETLIYDNKCNAIIKFVNRDKLVQRHMLYEEWQPLRPQHAVIIKAELKYAIVSSTLLETVEPEQLQSPNGSKEVFKEANAVRQLLDIAQLLKQTISETETELLKRSTTSPTLPSAVARQAANAPMERRERLHPQLWKRYHSYPLSNKLDEPLQLRPISPNTRVTAPSVVSTPNSKILVKQQHSTPDQAPVQVASTQQKSSRVASKTGKGTARLSSNVSYVAHASSHALCGDSGTPRISSTQRRLSYDPRATLKRSATLKRVDVAQPAVGAVEQRQRFQQLVAQQAEEQQRLQTKFQAQQQLLMDQMMCDMSTVSYDRDAHTDQSNSECSSINSLPQSRLDMELYELESDA